MRHCVTVPSFCTISFLVCTRMYTCTHIRACTHIRGLCGTVAWCFCSFSAQHLRIYAYTRICVYTRMHTYKGFMRHCGMVLLFIFSTTRTFFKYLFFIHTGMDEHLSTTRTFLQTFQDNFTQNKIHFFSCTQA